MLTVVEVKAEQGYATSGMANVFNLWLLSESSTQMESYTVDNGWAEGSNTFWD